jgi:NADPH-dependent F420 reductase
MARIAILGGTGPEGVGLAMRLAHVGEEVVVGSRQASRAGEAAARISAAVPGARVSGDVNEAVIADATYVVLSFPFEGLTPFLTEHGEKLAGKIVVDIINPLVVRRGVFSVPQVPEGSAGELAQHLAPKARVVGAFKTLSAEHLQHLQTPLVGDVLLCGADEDAKREVAGLVRRIPDLRPLDAGALVNSRAIEGITALLLNLNRRYKATTSVRILGID